MPLFTNLASLSQTPSANAPDGSVDPPSTLDDQLRLLASFIAQLRDRNYTAPAGTVLQEVVFPQQSGGSTSSAVMTGIANSQNFTPKSANSTLHVSITFEGCQNVMSGVNPQAFFAINVDGSYLTEHRLDAGSSAGGIGVRAPITLTGTYNNTSLSPKGVNLGVRVATTGATADALLVKMSVREVQK